MVSEHKKIGGFIESLNLPKYIASVLFETWNDCVTFLNRFYKKNQTTIDDLLDFREYKISKSNKSLSEFTEDYKNNGLKISFERTFYQSFDNASLVVLEKAIANGLVSIEGLFNKFKANPNKNIMKYVL